MYFLKCFKSKSQISKLLIFNCCWKNVLILIMESIVAQENIDKEDLVTTECKEETDLMKAAKGCMDNWIYKV